MYERKNHSKYRLNAHIVFVVKYRKQLLVGAINEFIKNKCFEIANRSNFDIDILETDKDHIHLLVNYEPKISLLSIVRRLKQETTFHVWKNFDLSKEFWKERTFWSDGYFVCSIGEASSDTIRKYIESQG